MNGKTWIVGSDANAYSSRDRSSKETWKCTVREPSLRSPIYQVGNGSRRRSRKIVEKCTVSSKLRIDAR